MGIVHFDFLDDLAYLKSKMQMLHDLKIVDLDEPHADGVALNTIGLAVRIV